MEIIKQNDKIYKEILPIEYVKAVKDRLNYLQNVKVNAQAEIDALKLEIAEIKLLGVDTDGIDVSP